MPPIIIEDNESAVMKYYPETKIVHHEFKKFMSGENFRQFLLKGTETLKKNGGTKWLSDDRKNPVLRSEDMDWARTNWFPQTIQAGWKYWAIIQSEYAITKLNVDKAVKEYSQAGIVARYFTNVEEAKKWLESQP